MVCFYGGVEKGSDVLLSDSAFWEVDSSFLEVENLKEVSLAKKIPFGFTTLKKTLSDF